MDGLKNHRVRPIFMGHTCRQHINTQVCCLQPAWLFQSLLRALEISCSALQRCLRRPGQRTNHGSIECLSRSSSSVKSTFRWQLQRLARHQVTGPVHPMVFAEHMFRYIFVHTYDCRSRKISLLEFSVASQSCDVHQSAQACIICHVWASSFSEVVVESQSLHRCFQNSHLGSSR